jgi:hypothetical protein
MLRLVDKSFAVLLFVGAALHAYGSLVGYPLGSEVLVWALSGTLSAGLIAVLNFVRANRPHDQTLAWITAGSSLCWAAVALGFGVAIGNPIDPRVLWHVLAALALAGFGLRQLSVSRMPARAT